MAASLNEAIRGLKEVSPLILAHNLAEPLLKEDTETSIFFGTGLCSKDTLSTGLPFDFLSYLYRSRKNAQAA